MTQQTLSHATLAATSTDIGAILEPIKSELELVEKWLVSNLVDDSTFISDLLAQVFQAGGKRIRPAVSLLSAKATSKNNGEVSRLHIILAVLTELIHTASLVHDDVLDSASLRRGQETVNRKWSDRLAVLIGDLLFAQASVCLARLMNPEVVGIYGQVLGDLCAGEIRQMRAQFITNLDWDTYIQKSVWKTASLISAGTHAAPILNGCSMEIVGAMKDYGLNLGICFQIIDDLLDYTSTSATLGKPAGSDLAQGIVTAPALFVLQRKDQRAERLEAIIKTRAVSTPEGIEEALTIVREGGGIDATVEMARNYAEKARKSLDVLDDSVYRDSLDALIDWLLMRTK